MRYKLIISALLCPLAAISTLRAQDAVTTPVGFNRVTCLSASDTIVSVPFMKQPLGFVGRLGADATVPGGGNTARARLVPTPDPNWTTNQFGGRFYLRFTSGAKAGMWYQVAFQDGLNAVVIELDGDTMTGMNAGDSFMIVEYWTLATLFPPETQKTIHPSTGTSFFQRRSQVFFPDYGHVGVNIRSAATFFLTSNGWVRDAPGYPAAGNFTIPPGSVMTIRHPAGVADTNFEPSGVVLTSPDTTVIATSSTTSQDNYVALMRPINLAWWESGFNPVVTASTGHGQFQRRDQVFVFDNSVRRFNRPLSAAYYRFNGTWYRDIGAGSQNPEATVEKIFQPSSAVIVRKAVSDGQSRFLVNTPTY